MMKSILNRRFGTGKTPPPVSPPSQAAMTSQPQGSRKNINDPEKGRVITQSGSYRWHMKGFTQIVGDDYLSDTFTVAGCTWRMHLFPKGNGIDGQLSLYLKVAEPERLPKGWSIEAKVKLTIEHLYDSSLSITRVTPLHVFSAREKSWGLKAFKDLEDVVNYMKGFRVNDTVVIVAEVAVYKVSLPEVAADVTETKAFDSYFTELEQFLKSVSDPATNVEGISSKRTYDWTFEMPSLEEVKKAKQSLRECLDGSFDISIKGKLYTALSTLRKAEGNMSSEQKMLIRSLFANFDDFIGGFITFEHESSKLEMHKLRSGQFISAMKKNSEIHISFKESFEKLVLEEKMLEMRLTELRNDRTKLAADWKELKIESEEVRSSYVAEQTKIAKAEEEMKKSEEGRARSVAAWGRMKELFT